MKEDFVVKLLNTLNKEQIKTNESLKSHTTLQIGGNADYFATPTKDEEIIGLINLCKRENMPCFIMGNGSNLLVSDDGYRGLIISINEQYASIEISDNGIVRAKAGVLLSKLSKAIAEKDFTGFEFAEGIPGTLGGGVAMNAGAYGGEIKDVIIEAKILSQDGNILVLDKEALALGYRKSIIQEKDYILLEAVFKFEKGNKEDIKAKMIELRNARREKQPIEKLSAGSTFKRPEGYFAGKLIADCGLRGFTIGGISVSEKHCGFVINDGSGTAKEFLLMIEHIKRRVKEEYGVILEPEIKLLGEFY